MIIDNVIYFGYGDILVRADWTGTLTLTEIQPPCIPGGSINYEDKVMIRKIYIYDIEKHNIDYLQLMKDVGCKAITQFPIDNYIFDFSNFNLESIKVVRQAIDIALFGEYRLRAC